MSPTTPARPRTRAASRATAGTALAVALGAALALGAPLSASAHATLVDNTAEAGSYALLTFKVPNESATAATTEVTITLPTDTPFASVRTVPVAGWDAEIVRGALPEPVEIGESTLTEAALAITFTATDGGLTGADLGLFTVSLGPVPDVGQIELPVIQTYSDGAESRWEGDDVPVLYVNDAPPAGGHHGGGHGEAPGHGDGDDSGEHAAGDDAPDSTSVAAIALGAVGVLLGGAALAVSLIRRRPEQS